jgi:hypothetical protein
LGTFALNQSPDAALRAASDAMFKIRVEQRVHARPARR